VCDQVVTAGATGNIFVRYQATSITNNFTWQLCGTGCFNVDTSSCHAGSGNWCVQNLGAVTNGASSTFSVGLNRGSSTPDSQMYFVFDNFWVGSSGNTPTPVPSATPTITNTPAPGTPTNTVTVTQTPVPIPGAMSTNIPTATECPGGCAVAALTQIPGLSTRVTVDTSPFSPFTSLSLARSSCAAFGYAQIPYPVIHGTPALGSTTPLSVTWTLPVTHDWDNTQPFSNTAIEPCAMSEIPTYIWDFTYWLSVLGCAIVFIMWLIGVIGRLSGDETING
jgi:hypothetical protein